MIVKSAPGTQCPREDNPKTYITETEAVEVPDTAYYHRLVDDGSLVPAKLSKKTGGDQ
ncbi:hypothetical protein GMLC_14610 [Geomonas limicola]|uniref:DUF2635 domain-containing protein n=1 Tax=Geomonas limicola TaxID=2740186 RepID=A0A6V8N5P3_9BACT|nr:hypothetical protein [Geomonas limicola]GFO67882.1 hypothetical protein GMLC_14610 [Geomonas limicola]